MLEEAPRVSGGDRRECPTDGLHECPWLRASALLRNALTFEKASSMGLRSGE